METESLLKISQRSKSLQVLEHKRNHEGTHNHLVQFEIADNDLVVGDSISLYSDTYFLCAEGFSESPCTVQTGRIDITPPNFQSCIFRVNAVVDDVNILFEDKNERIGEKFFCDACKNVCEMFRYQSIKEYKFTLCVNCYEIENFPAHISLQDFEEIPINGSRRSFRSLGEPIRYGQAIQLKHIFSDKLVSVKTKIDCENSNASRQGLYIFIEQEEALDSWFVILPRYKVHTHGEKVQVGDQIVLLNVKWQRYLGTSSGFMNPQVRADHSKYGWKLLLYSSYMKEKEEQGQNIIKGGSVVRFFHLETETHFSYDALKYNFEDRESRELFCRKTGDLKRKYNDSNTLWQIVLLNPVNGGAMIEWNNEFRLRHLASGLYLSVKEENGTYVLEMVFDHLSSSTLFSFSPFKKSDRQKKITFSSKLMLYHVSTKTYFHTDSEHPKQSTHKNSQKSSLSQTGYEAFFNTFSQQENAIIVIPAHLQEAVQLTAVKESATILNSFVRKVLSQEPISEMYFSKVLDTIGEMITFCILTQEKDPLKATGKPIRSRQAIFRAQRIIEILFDILRILPEKKDKFPFGYTQMTFLVFRLLGYLVELYPKTSTYIFDQINFFHQQLLLNYDEDLLAEIVKAISNIFLNNRTLLEQQDVIETFVHAALHLATIKQGKTIYIKFLTMLCLCENNPISHNQVLICKALLEDSKYSSLLYPIKIENGEALINPSSTSFQNFSVFSKSNPLEVEFYESVIKLISSTCKGRNYSCMEIASKIFPYELVNFCLQLPSLKGSVRAIFSDLLLNIYLDSSPNHVIGFLHYSRFWTNLDGSQFSKQDKREDLNEEKTRDWTDLKDFVKSHLETFTQQKSSKLSYQVLVLFRHLVMFGKVNQSFIPQSTLMNILEFKGPEEDPSWIEAKVELLQIMDMLADRKLDARVSKFLQYYKNFYEKNSDFDNLDPNELNKMELDAELWTFIDRPQGILQQLVANLGLPNTSDALNPEKFFSLIDYPHKTLNISAFRFLIRFFNERAEIRNFIAKTRILVNQYEFDLYLKVRSNLHEIKKTLSGGLNTPEQTHLFTLIPSLSNLLKQDDIIIKENQNLLFHFNTHESILDVIQTLHPFSTSVTVELAKKCYSFLTDLCKQNPIIQGAFWERIDTFVSNLKYLDEVAEFLIEVVTNNFLICSSVTENQLNSFFSVINKRGKKKLFIKLLQSFLSVKIEGKPNKPTQRMMIKLLQENKELIVLFTTPKEKKQKKELIEKGQMELIEYHGELIQLLASCAQENPEVQTICSTLLSVNDIISSITEENQFDFIQVSFIHLLSELYQSDSSISYTSFQELFKKFSTDIDQVLTSGKLNDLVSAAILPFIVKFFTHSPEYQFHIKYMNELIRLLDSLLSFYKLLESIQPEKKILMLGQNALNKVGTTVGTFLLKNLNIEKIVSEISTLSEEQLQKTILSNNPTIPDSQNHAKRIYQLHQILKQTVQKEKDSGYSKLTTSLRASMQELQMEDKINKKLSNFTREIVCANNKLTGELDRTVAEFEKPEYRKYLVKLIHLIRDPAIITNKKFEDTIILSLRAIREMLLKGQLMDEESVDALNRMIFQLLKTAKEKRLYETLRVACTLYSGGNSIAQQSLLNYLDYSDPHNEFFLTIHTLMQQFEKELKHEQMLIQNHYKGYEIQQTHRDVIVQFFRFLQLLCEGPHHLKDSVVFEFQNTLRAQTTSDNYNIVLATVSYLGVLSRSYQVIQHQPNISDEQKLEKKTTLLTIAVQVLTSLNEYIIQNTENQLCILESNRLFNPLNELLQIDLSIPTEEHNHVNKLSSKMLDLSLHILDRAAIFLLSFLEGHPEKKLVDIIIENLNISNLKVLMKQLSHFFSNQSTILRHFTPKEQSDLKELGISFYIILHKLFDYNESLQTTYFQEPWFQSLQKVLNPEIGCIEIVRENALENVYFRIPEMALQLWKNSEIQILKETLLYTVNRENNYEKIEDFFDQAQDLMVRLKYTSKLFFWDEKTLSQKEIYQKKATAFCAKNYRRFEDTSYYLVLLITFIMLFGYTTNSEGTMYILPIYDETILTLSVWHVIFSVLRLSGYLMMNIPPLIEAKKREKQSSQNQETTGLSNFTKTSIFTLQTKKSFVSLYSPFYCTIHLLDSLFRFRLLYALLKQCVSENNRQILFQTAVLALTFFYIYAALGFLFFRTAYVDSNGNSQCATLLQCFFFHVYDGARAGGGIGDILTPPSYGNLEYFGRVFFDLTFYIIIVVILIAIITGIIIDAFGAIRDDNNQIIEDMKSKCFICSIENGQFKRYGKGFLKHIKEDHNMWNYLFFMLYLELKEETEFSAQEAYVSEMIKSRNLGFFPIGRAMILAGVQTHEINQNEK